MPKRDREPLTYLVLVLGALAVSGVGPYDRLTWVLETLPVMLVVPLLVVTRRTFPLTPLLYRLIFIHALILIIGAHYTYSRVPAGFWVQDLFDLARNHYDRLGHLAQGFVPAMVAREILLRMTPLCPGGWLFVLVSSFCLAFSALYELMEWGTAIVLGHSADAFLATQGDVWDTQWDMFLALVGAIMAQVMISRIHDRQLARLGCAGRPDPLIEGGPST